VSRMCEHSGAPHLTAAAGSVCRVQRPTSRAAGICEPGGSGTGVCKRYIVPGASHKIKPVKSDNDLGFAGDVASEAAAELRSWLGKKLGSIGKNGSAA
jgi:hypothetical protein